MIDPISLAVIAGTFAVGAVVGVVVVKYWDNIKSWIKKIWEKLPIKIKKNLQGATSFVKRLGNSFSNIMNYYSHDEKLNQWSITTFTQEVDEDTIPEHIRAKLKQKNEVDTTQDLERELKISLS